MLSTPRTAISFGLNLSTSIKCLIFFTVLCTISSKELIYYIQNEIRNQYPYKYKFMESYMFDFNCNIKEVCYAKEENLINFTSVTPYNDIHFEYNPSILSKYNTIFLLFVEQ